MDGLLLGLQSSDTKTRVTSAEQLYGKLKQKASIDHLEFDIRNRVATTILTLVEDINPKLSLIGLDCLQTLLECQSESFQPYLNRAFDLLVIKFGDTKVSVNTFMCHVAPVITWVF